MRPGGTGLTTDRRRALYPDERLTPGRRAMDTLQEQLDRSFGDGPPLPPVGSHVAAGRRALRRRRAASGVTGLAAAAVLVTGGYAVWPGSPTGSDPAAGEP